MNVKFIHCTPEAEKIVAYCARVSSPKNQHSEDISKLLAYCAKHKHWSIFQMSSLCIEVKTTRAIAAQIIRHRSLNVQEFSQRYSEVDEYEECSARETDSKNRQQSNDTLSEDDKIWFKNAQEDVWNQSYNLYKQALKKNVAKECARFLLPLNTSTTLYIHATLRDWIHYINVRTEDGVQAEHKSIALECKAIFCQQFPVIAKALNWV